MPEMPVNLYDAKNMVERGVRTAEEKTRGAVMTIRDTLAATIPEGVKEGWRELRGYRTKARQRHGDIALPREGTRAGTRRGNGGRSSSRR